MEDDDDIIFCGEATRVNSSFIGNNVYNHPAASVVEGSSAQVSFNAIDCLSPASSNTTGTDLSGDTDEVQVIGTSAGKSCSAPTQQSKPGEQGQSCTLKANSKCNTCGLIVPRSQLFEHMMSHGAMYSCPFCPLKFNKRDVTLRHLKTFHAESVAMAVRIEKQKREMRNNNSAAAFSNGWKVVPVSTPKNGKTISATPDVHYCGCLYCSESYPNLSKLNVHLYENHHNEYDRLARGPNNEVKVPSILVTAPAPNRVARFCEFCGTLFPDEYIASKHKQTCRINRDTQAVIANPYCPICRMAFVDLSELKAHCKKTHTSVEADRLRVCDVCGLFFPNKTTLMFHLKSKHTRSVLCDICKRSFPQQEDFAMHLHTQEDCWKCRTNFLSICEFNLHIRKHLHWDKSN